jgi:calcineurin-like phosphoesterase family protein
VKPRVAAVWEPLLLHGFVMTRDAVNVKPLVKQAFHGMVRTYVRLGWLDHLSGQLCVICHQPAQVWHHPSYERGFHDVVQPMCDSCHNRQHATALRHFVANPNPQWDVWRTEEAARIADPLIETARELERARSLGFRNIHVYRAHLAKLKAES